MVSLTLLPNDSGKLEKIYERAFQRACELYVVSAYLTNWNGDLKLSRGCKVRIIVGKDFGITRKEACKQVRKWLPANCKHNFYVAAYIGGFHPKAIFWKEQNGKSYMLVGSSNLTEAAFKSNYEANLYSPVSPTTYQNAIEWIEELIQHSRPVDRKWLAEYKEAKLVGKKRGGSQVPKVSSRADDFPLPEVSEQQANEALNDRRRRIRAFAQIRKPLKRLFLDGASGQIHNDRIFERLNEIWGDHRSRFQGKGFERRGAKSDWAHFCRGVTKILKAGDADRDEVVIATIDEFATAKLPTRWALLSEMLCHFFPDKYPLINGPVRLWIKKMKYRAPTGASEGAKYIDMAEKMRATVANDKNGSGEYKVRNLAELDHVIWAKYEKEYQRKRRAYS